MKKEKNCKSLTKHKSYFLELQDPFFRQNQYKCEDLYYFDCNKKRFPETSQGIVVYFGLIHFRSFLITEINFVGFL